MGSCPELEKMLSDLKFLTDPKSEEVLRHHFKTCPECIEAARTYCPVEVIDGLCKDCGRPSHPVSDVHSDACWHSLVNQRRLLLNVLHQSLGVACVHCDGPELHDAILAYQRYMWGGGDSTAGGVPVSK